MLASWLISFGNPFIKKKCCSNALNSKIKLHQCIKLSSIGDFNGDGIPDTIFQHLASGITKTEIIYSADPFKNDWDIVVQWFNDQKADLFLTLSNSKDTLHLGPAQGLYCLINVGDNNADGKDEIALVIDYLDFSRVNSCKIFTFCNGKWTLIKQFGVFEGSFDFSSKQAPIFKNIKDHLEKRNDVWVFKDYFQHEDENEGGIMLPLHLDSCQ